MDKLRVVNEEKLLLMVTGLLKYYYLKNTKVSYIHFQTCRTNFIINK